VILVAKRSISFCNVVSGYEAGILIERRIHLAKKKKRIYMK